MISDERLKQLLNDDHFVTRAEELPLVRELLALRRSRAEMLEALKEVAEAFVLYGEDRGPIGKKVVAAIAKAEGREVGK